jgi:hypothetical protein
MIVLAPAIIAAPPAPKGIAHTYATHTFGAMAIPTLATPNINAAPATHVYVVKCNLAVAKAPIKLPILVTANTHPKYSALPHCVSESFGSDTP